MQENEKHCDIRNNDVVNLTFVMYITFIAVSCYFVCG